MNTHAPPAFQEHRPAYPEVVAFGAPRGTRIQLRLAAADAGLSVSELIRRAVARFMSGPAGQPRANAEA